MREIMKPNIYFWSADTSGCGFYRMHLPSESLLLGGKAYTTESTRLDAKIPYQIVVAQRTTGVKQSEIFKEISESATLAVMEIDDDLFNVPKHNLAHGFYIQPEVRKQLAGNLAVANLVTVSTEYLGKRMREYTDAPIEVLPNCLNLRRFPKRLESSRGLSVGWAGSGTHRADLEAVAGPLKRAVDKAGAQFVGVGADYTDTINAKDSRYIGWSDDIYAYYELLNFDIGVAPLEDNEFNRSKSPVKALEYGARGIPTVASDVEPYAKYIEHGVDGFLVRYDHEWGKYIGMLRDPELRAKMGAAARAKAETFDITERAGEWLDVYSRHTTF
jgi:glycosyltransferase involved in cell wall biosynthesis